MFVWFVLRTGVADGVYLRSVSGRADGDIFRPLGGKQAGRECGPSHGCGVRDGAVAGLDRDRKPAAPAAYLQLKTPGAKLRALPVLLRYGLQAHF